MAAEPLLPVALEALLAQLLRLGGAALNEPDRDEDVQRELEVLRLPVLRHRLAVRRRGDVVAEGDRRRVVLGLVGVERVVAGDRLAGQGEQEERQEAEREPVLVGEVAEARAHW
jgi:hypothetical protein